MKRTTSILIVVLEAVLAGGTLALWACPLAPAEWQAHWPGFVRGYYAGPGQAIAPRQPGQDNRVETPTEPVDLTGRLDTFDVPGDSSSYAIWPWFRGEARDNVNLLSVALRRTFGPDGPEVLWSVSLGEGYAGPAVRNGRVYLLDYDQEHRSNVLRCLSLADGRDIWRRSWQVYVKRQHGMSRTVPAVTDKYVVALGPMCTVVCCRAETGEFLWGRDLVAEYGTTVPQWYAGQCPLIDNGRAILAPTGPDALAVAIDCETGEELWRTPNPAGWRMTHASILPVVFAGRTIYLVVGSGGVAGIDSQNGQLVFVNTDWTVKIATIPTPVDLGEGRIFLSGGYGAGSMFLQLTQRDGRIEAISGKRLGPDVFGTEQQTPIFYDGHLFGVLPRSGAASEQMTCLDRDGRRVWLSGPADRFGLGAYLIADGMIIAVSDDGVLTLAEASPAGWNRLARAKVLPGHECWAPMVVADGRLLVRDLTEMRCLDLRQSEE